MLSIIILAAGKGTRMKSKLPKVMQPLAGRPLLEHVLLNARELKPSSIIVVYGYGGDQVQDYFKHDTDIEWAHQTEQLGTGHAVKQAIGSVPDQNRVLILYGDVPLISHKTLDPLVNNKNNELELLTAIVPDGSGYGRIIREEDRIIGIIEESDADEKVRKINEINTGIMSCRANQMKNWLDKLKNDNKKQEYYLTDIVDLAVQDEIAIHGHKSKIWEESMGINDKSELAKAERLLQKKLATQYMKAGLTLMDPSRIDIRGSLRHGQDVSVDVNVVFEGGQSDAELAGTVSAVSIGLGAAALVTGVTLFLLHDGGGEELASTDYGFPSLSFAPNITPTGADGGSVSFSLQF